MHKWLIVLFSVASLGLCAQVVPDAQTAKPWTYWWWMGSAVEHADLQRQLETFAAAGLGGVHIIPIYGVHGYEDRFLPFLSEEWMEAVEFTMATAADLNLGVDLTLGTGWPFGGPWVTPEYAAQHLALTENGFSSAPTGQQVKRAAPGGEGAVMDYFSAAAVEHYLAHFDSVFAQTDHPIDPRAYYHDSYEVYGADWTPDFPQRFAQLRGYGLEDRLYLLRDTLNPLRPAFLHDVRETLSDLLYSEFAQTWTDYSTQNGHLTRLQAHGSPGNILDLYGLSDIPETESFGCSEFPIPGLDCDPDYNEDNFGRPSSLMMKFASSPAHLLGKPLVSSETGTWLANHFKVALRRVKPQIDQLFVSGINHIFYHGTTYSPEAEGFPGWLFYASTNFGPTSHFSGEFPLLNDYVTACQRELQSAAPDNDVLLYFPIHDLWTKDAGKVLLQLDVHHYDEWFGATDFGAAAHRLEDAGVAFDYVSDSQLGQLEVGVDGQVSIGGNARYLTVVVPAIDYLPPATLEALQDLGRKGVRILFDQHFPTAFSGGDAGAVDTSGLRDGPGIRLTSDLVASLDEGGIRRESLKEAGLDFIRKTNEGGTLYFVTNLGNTFSGDSVALNADYRYVTIHDPLNGRQGYLETEGRFFLDLLPGQSCFLQASMERPDAEKWIRLEPVDTIVLTNPWTVHFAGAAADRTYARDSLTSWTEWNAPELDTFMGKATYSTSLHLDPEQRDGAAYRLVLPDVYESAQVFVNGNAYGTVWSYPNTLHLPAAALRGDNRIELVVQNLSANYLRAYDTAHPEWKKFYDINFVDITYRPFEAARWPLQPSGLAGQVRLVKLR